MVKMMMRVEMLERRSVEMMKMSSGSVPVVSVSRRQGLRLLMSTSPAAASLLRPICMSLILFCRFNQRRPVMSSDGVIWLGRLWRMMLSVCAGGVLQRGRQCFHPGSQSLPACTVITSAASDSRGADWQRVCVWPRGVWAGWGGLCVCTCSLTLWQTVSEKVGKDSAAGWSGQTATEWRQTVRMNLLLISAGSCSDEDDLASSWYFKSCCRGV